MDKQKRSYCVYKHTSPNGKVYIGITAQQPERRWQNGYGYIRNSHFTYAIQKYGWNNFKHEILEMNLSYKEACDKEKFYIKTYNSTNSEYGYNISKDGDSVNSTPVKMYLIDGTFIDRFDSIAEASHIMNIYDSSISNAIAGLSKTAGAYLWTKDDTVLDTNSIPKFSDLELAKINKIKIKQYDINGNLLKIFDSLEDIRKTCKIPPASIFKVCTGKLNMTHNHVWRFEEDAFDKYIDNFRVIRNDDKFLRLLKTKKRKYENIPIYQYNLDGSLNGIYKDIYCIAQISDWQYSHIISCLNHEEDSCDGYVYRFDRDIEFEKKWIS